LYYIIIAYEVTHHSIQLIVFSFVYLESEQNNFFDICIDHTY